MALEFAKETFSHVHSFNNVLLNPLLPRSPYVLTHLNTPQEGKYRVFHKILFPVQGRCWVVSSRKQEGQRGHPGEDPCSNPGQQPPPCKSGTMLLSQAHSLSLLPESGSPGYPRSLLTTGDNDADLSSIGMRDRNGT